jgi:hypothetical protein
MRSCCRLAIAVSRSVETLARASTCATYWSGASIPLTSKDATRVSILKPNPQRRSELAKPSAFVDHVSLDHLGLLYQDASVKFLLLVNAPPALVGTGVLAPLIEREDGGPSTTLLFFEWMLNLSRFTSVKKGVQCKHEGSTRGSLMGYFFANWSNKDSSAAIK